MYIYVYKYIYIYMYINIYTYKVYMMGKILICFCTQSLDATHCSAELCEAQSASHNVLYGKTLVKRVTN